MNSIKKIISKIKKQQQLVSKGVYDKYIYSNNHIDIIHDTCRLCYNGKKEATKEDKLAYIERRVKTGHESILEHSNIVIYIAIEKDVDNLLELTEVIENCKYLNTKIKIDNKFIHTLIGGSLRGYKHIFRNIENQDNKIAKLILNNLYLTNKEYFTDFIEDNIMDEFKFRDLEFTYPAIRTNKILNENINIINIDDINYIYEQTEGIFTKEDLLDFCTVTIFFKDISRIISQQITRHRNAITQLSQRYVNYSGDEFGFNSPTKYKDKYDKNHVYGIYFNDTYYELTLEELGKELMKIYDQLVDKKLKEHKLLPEDARAYLPNNAQTSLYMTFTFKNLIKFLQLRTDSHAQAEIRLLAQTIEKEFRPLLEDILGHDIYDTLIPKYKLIAENEDLYEGIDEVIE